jgi:Rrf2 family iron-sulfur cluster assembly transcriptional regulator
VRMTRGADYGARGVIRLARAPQGQIMLVSEIAAREGLPESYLAKIFQELARSGIVRSHRGAGGGFSLARPAEAITLRQIVEAIQGPLALNTCLDAGAANACDQVATCALYPVLQRAQQQLVSILDETTLAELVARGD